MIKFDQTESLVRFADRVTNLASAQPKRNVLENGHVREESIALEDGVHLSLIRLEMRHIFSTDEYRTLGGGL